MTLQFLFSNDANAISKLTFQYSLSPSLYQRTNEQYLSIYLLINWVYGNIYVDCFDQLSTYSEIALSSSSVLKKTENKSTQS